MFHALTKYKYGVKKHFLTLYFMSTDSCLRASALTQLKWVLNRLYATEVVQWYKSMTVGNTLHLNKGRRNKKPLRWHVNWQTNCLICVCCVKGAFHPWAWGQPKFTSDWSLMAHGGFCRTVSMETKVFSRFPTDWNALFFLCLKCVMWAK